MLRVFIICCCVLAIASSSVLAQGEIFGLGMILGEPTGVTGKMWMTNNTAIDAAVAWSFSDENALHLHADYLFHNMSLLRVDHGTLGLYFGFGGRLKFDEDDSLGIRIPVGLAYMFENAPVDIFVEIVPLMDVIPDTAFNPNAALGARYFFGRR